MTRLRDALLTLLLFLALLYLWWQWRKYEGWATKYPIRCDAGEAWRWN